MKNSEKSCFKTRNPLVAGSNPAGPKALTKMPKWLAYNKGLPVGRTFDGLRLAYSGIKTTPGWKFAGHVVQAPQIN
jgi:hypothetical protein